MIRTDLIRPVPELLAEHAANRPEQQMMRTSPLWAVVIALWAFQASARDYYVDNLAGNDRFDGTQPQSTSAASGSPKRPRAAAGSASSSSITHRSST